MDGNKDGVLNSLVGKVVDDYIATKLKNGATIQATKLNGARSTVILIGYNAGGFYEEGHGKGSNDGISHFLEHMVFKGNERINARFINEAFTKFGALPNAYTSYYKTVYFSKAPKKNFEKVINLWLDILNGFSLPEKDFEIERQVVLQEIKIHNDDPLSYAISSSQNILFENTPYGHDILGSIESLEGITREMMLEYVNQRYTPENMDVVVVGDLPIEDVIASIEQKINNSNRGSARTKHDEPWDYFSRKWKGKTGFVREERAHPIANVVISWPIKISSIDEFFYPFILMEDLLNEGKTSLFYKKIVSKGLCSNVEFNIEKMPIMSFAQLYFSAEPKNVPVIYDKILKIFGDLKNNQLEPQLVDYLKKREARNLLLSMEDSMNLAQVIFRRLSIFNKFSDPKMTFRDVENITFDKMNAVKDILFSEFDAQVFACGNIPKEWEPKTSLE
ncbi:MAG: M16 family metallopeptidase [Promethearchaeota archaeon]